MRAKRRLTLAGLLVALLSVPGVARAQGPAASGGASDPFAVRGVAFAGVHLFTPGDTFDAVLGSSSGATFGGGINVKIPGGLFAQVVAWRFSGERNWELKKKLFECWRITRSQKA